METRKKKTTLVIGNGFNRCANEKGINYTGAWKEKFVEGKALEYSWDAILNRVSGEHVTKDKVMYSDFSYPLWFETIANDKMMSDSVKQNKDTYTTVKSSYADEVRNLYLKPDAPHYAFAKLAYDGYTSDILTTNYEFLLEESIYNYPTSVLARNAAGDSSVVIKDDDAYKTAYYKINKQHYASQTKDGLPQYSKRKKKGSKSIRMLEHADQEFLRKERIISPDGNYLKGQSVVVRHIHGDINKPADICLGFEHYINITQKLRNMLSPIFRYDVFWKNGLKSSNEHLHNNQYKVYVPDTWAFRFFVDDMDIAGFGLPSSETDIWWLLAYRAKQYYIGEKILQGRKNTDSEHVIMEYISNKIYYHDIIPISNKRMMDDSEKKRRVFETFKVEYRRYIVDDWSDFAFAYGEIARMIAERLEGNESMEIVEGKEVPQWSFDFTDSDNISINDK